MLEGKYIGTYTDFSTEKPIIDNLWIDISKPTKNSMTETIEFKNIEGSKTLQKTYPSMTFDFKKSNPLSSKKQIDFKVFQLNASGDSFSFQLEKNKQTSSQKNYDTECYYGYDSTRSYRAVICVNDADLSIEIEKHEEIKHQENDRQELKEEIKEENRDKDTLQTDTANKKPPNTPLIQITGSRFLGTTERAKLEEPRDLTLDDAVQLALTQATELLIENQVVFRTQRSSTAGRLALFPHISYALTGIASSVSDPISAIGFLGDLAPFLFPAHWIRSQEGPLRVRIELDAARIIKLNLVSQVQTLAYLYNRDVANFQQREKMINRLNDEIIPVVRHLEAEGLVLPRSTELLLTNYNQASEDLKALNNLIQDDLYALSLALGFLNPLAVSGVDIGVEDEPIEIANTCDEPQVLGEQGYRVSIERRQIQTSKILALKEKSELYYNWFDPDGNSSTALGPGLFEEIKITKSKFHELELKELLIQKSIFNNSAVICNDYNRSLNSYYRVRKIRIERQELFEKLVSDLKEADTLRKKFATPTQDFADAFNNLLKSVEELAVSVGNFRLYRTQIQRILLTGRFHDVLLPDHGEIPDLQFLLNLPLGLNFQAL